MMTLKELKKIVKVADVEKRFPSKKVLSQKEVVVKERIGSNIEITVYANGFVLYEEEKRSTIFPLHDCKEYSYQHVDETIDYLKEDFFDNENWYIRLLMEATDRVEKNLYANDRKYDLFSYSDMDPECSTLEDKSESFVDNIANREFFCELLEELQVLTRKVFVMYYLEGMTQKEISEELNIKQQMVSYHKRRAVSILKKVFEEKK